jgi:hypothetical protein
MKHLALTLTFCLSYLFSFSQDYKKNEAKEVIKINSSIIANTYIGPVWQIAAEKDFDFKKVLITVRFGYNQTLSNSDYVYIQNIIGYKINEKHIVSICPTWFEGTIPKNGYYTPSSIVYTYKFNNKIQVEAWTDFLIGRVSNQVRISYTIFSVND